MWGSVENSQYNWQHKQAISWQADPQFTDFTAYDYQLTSDMGAGALLAQPNIIELDADNSVSLPDL